MSNDIFIWLGIAFCLSQSAVFSGLNLAYFSLSRLQLEVEAGRSNQAALKVLSLREDSNFLLATILWGNVSINVLLTLLSDSVLVGLYAFLFSSVAITILGEIIPQAYFSRNALNVGSLLKPVINFYQLLLYPVAKPTAIMLDGWLGKEGITYLRDKELKGIIKAHIDSEEAEVEHVEGIGAINFLSVEDIQVSQEGEVLDPASIIELPCRLDLPTLPEPGSDEFRTFIQQVHKSGHKWVVLTDNKQQPQLTLDADGFIRSALLDNKSSSTNDTTAANFDPYQFCHRPIVVKDSRLSLGEAMKLLKEAAGKDSLSDEVMDKDIILVWTAEQCRVITGADILGRLLKGIGSVPQQAGTKTNSSDKNN
ncbi:DUF21 domain-containing protein [Dasania sp. GY-MA-18]|uniref:DUF21 domain-containing protein n=1 Tax=Dasania phycosphaerae TaxID=2950436 RepID=A0A9J6RLQ8_9GAMM|nr:MULTISPECIES: DUF21 domain-containing protein [Dasania]MCR8922949.1 DUF21 domain-containing protein [Dasania sp. GY-MA-18]MCZ0865380.1 DUF21 domain-containing protein [Dasania phycosphaerae]MCZ0869105.1 DUF21 domain-containing protein [Dasania phycosphaerae]